MNCRKLIYANIAVYVALKLLWLLLPENPSDFEAILPWIALPASLPAALSRPWTLLSYSFVQVDFLHLLVNMLWLGWFGSILTELRGNRPVWLLYLAGAAAGATGFLIQSYILAPATSITLTGASAATAAIVVAATALSPRYRVRLLFLGEIPVIIVAPIALISFFSGTQAAVGAHIGGILAGCAAAWFWRRRTRINTEKVRIFMRRQSRKQALLDKARSSGYGSLSDSERIELFNLTDNN